ncbi:MAG: DUF4159 domain-containing protein [Candidatus Poribacteria bacterium]|nr:DUF4159 domain-containing protein [Candidatus Poribacteria bacterium]
MLQSKPTSQSLMISLIIHGLMALGLSVYMIVHTAPFQDFMDATFLKSPDPPKPKVRKPVIKPVTKPIVPRESAAVVEPLQPQPRVTTAANLRTASVTTANVIEFSNRRLKLEARPQPYHPKIIDLNQPSPHVVTSVDLPTSDAPGALALGTPVASTGGDVAGLTRRGMSGIVQDVRVVNAPSQTGIASLLDTTSAAPNALDSMVGEMRLGNRLMIPMRHDQLGARISTDPQTGLPTGYFQFCYVRFRQRGMNPLFRVDPTALSYLVRWMSGSTRIRGRMTGRTLFLDDPRLLDSPMLYMNGVRGVRFRAQEKRNLTRYLVEKGGFIFVDDDHSGGSLATKAFANSMRAQFRDIILEAGGRELQRIPNDHPIWNQPFQLGGQPAEPNRTGRTWPMTAFELNGRLSVVISYNDYNNGWEEPGSATISYVPSVLRMGANFMFYAATHGKISDYNHYVPPDQWREEDILLPKRAPQAASISATGSDGE